MEEINVNFNGYDCIVKFRKYSNLRTAIELVDKDDNESVAIATINIPEVELNCDEIIIKDYSENEGILLTLVSYKIISRPVRYVNNGFVKVPIVKLLVTPYKWIE